MKHTLLHRFAIVSIAFGTFFSSASFAQADTLTIPQQYRYPGLAFSEPLTYSHPLPNQSVKTFSFDTPKTLEVAKNTTKKSLDAIVLTPTQVQEKQTPHQIPMSTIASLQSTQQPTIITSKPTPTVYVQPTAMPTPILPTQPPAPHIAGGLNPDKLFSIVNAYRTSKGLSALQQDARTCSLAASRAPEVGTELATGALHKGLQARNLPYWNTENIISMNSEEAAFNWWINDAIHRQAIEGNYTYSCVACSGNSCAQEFTNYQPK